MADAPGAQQVPPGFDQAAHVRDHLIIVVTWFGAGASMNCQANGNPCRCGSTLHSMKDAVVAETLSCTAERSAAQALRARNGAASYQGIGMSLGLDHFGRNRL